MDSGDDPEPNILDVTDRYKVSTPCLSQGWRARLEVGRGRRRQGHEMRGEVNGGKERRA